MSVLERRCRRLLRAYPAAYRHGREEEIIGTLMEATPAGRNWPPLRDARTLIAGGLRARSAQDWRQPTTVSMRLALILGVAIFLSFQAGAEGTGFIAPAERISALTEVAGLAAGVLMVASVVLAWAARHAMLIVISVAAAVLAIVSGAGFHFPGFSVEVTLGCLAVLSALTVGSERPPRHWLWLAAAAFLASVAAQIGEVFWPGFLFMTDAPSYVILAMIAFCIGWIGIDARPAIGLAAYLLLTGLIRGGTFLPVGGLPTALAELGSLAMPAALLAVPALWRLRHLRVL